MVIFMRELARNRKSFIIWALCLVLSNVAMLSIYPTFAKQADEYTEILKAFPKGMTGGLGIDKLNFGNIVDYFAYVFLYIVLFGGVYAMLLGSGILSKEENEKTIEFLMAKPVTRNTIVTAKALSVLFYLILLNVVFVLADFLTFEAVKKQDYDMGIFLTIHAGFFLLGLTFAAIGLLISVFVVKAKSVYPVSLGVVLGAFFLNIAAGITEKLENLKYLTPFKYVNPTDLAAKGSIETVYLIIMLSVIIITVAAAYVFYNRKNITV